MVVCVLCLPGCLGGDDDEPRRIRGDVATIYSSVPRHGISAAAAAEVLAGERHALEEHGGRTGGLRIRFVELPATDDEEHAWDPSLVAQNAHRAADDPTAIAYLGELDYGATAVSLPITNDAGLLQVSPGDGLTSLARRAPGRPRAGPERYYPSGTRNFVRIGPDDLDEAEAIVNLVGSAGATRVALLFDREIYGRELAAQVVVRARRTGLSLVASEEYRGRPDDVPEIVRKLAERHPDAVVHAGVANRSTVRMTTAIAEQLPGVPLVAASGMLADPGLAMPAGTRVEVIGPALPPRRAGYEAMRLVLDAVGQGGRDRRNVIAAALRRPVASDRLALYRPAPDGRFERVRIAP